MRSHSKALFAVAALCVFLSVPSSALAAKSVERVIQTGGTAGGLAVNTSTGELYVQILDGDRIERYDSSSGAFLGQFGASGDGDGEFEFGGAITGIAIDESDGSVYVSDIENDRVQKFQADGTFVSSFGSPGSGPGQLDLGPTTRVFPFASTSLGGGLGVNRTTGDVYVADTANNRVQRFSSAGAFEAELGVGQLEAPSQLGVDEAGAIFVLERAFNPASFNEGNIFRFSPSGSTGTKLSGPSGAFNFPSVLSVDKALGHLYVMAYGTQILELTASGAVVETHGQGAPDLSGGLSSDTTSGASGSGNLYGSTGTESRVYVLTDAGAVAPSATIGPVTDVGEETATPSGTVNANGDLPADWRFEYSTDGASWSSSAGGTVPADGGDVPVSETLTGLEVSTTYQVRLVAAKQFGGTSTTSGVETFTTEDVPPTVESPLPAGLLTDTSAWLGARVNPRNSATTYYVEYSTDPGFANSVRVPDSEDAPAGADGAFTTVSQHVTGLLPDTTYHFRLVATNIAGTTVGPARSFRTRAAPVEQPGANLPNGRVYEKVSPNEKAGVDVVAGPTSQTFRAVAASAPDGESVAFSATGSFGGGEGAPVYSQYIARRGPGGGWSTEGINARSEPVPETILNSNSPVWWMSDDLSTAFMSVRSALNPGDPGELVQNLYRRDNDTGTYRAASQGVPGLNRLSILGAQAIAPDGESVVFVHGSYETSYLGRLYEWSRGELREVGVMPDGSPVEAHLANQWVEMPGQHALSDDGDRVYFTPRDNEAVYLRDFSTDPPTTTLVSGSERSGEDPTQPAIGSFELASADGSIAFFEGPQPLTDESPTDVSLYKWDSTAPVGSRLTDLTAADPEGGGSLGTVAATDDTSVVYFVATGKLTDTAVRGAPNLYLWSEESEEVELVATLDHQDGGVWSDSVFYGELGEPLFRSARMSPDGRYLAFVSRAPLTSYDTAGTQQIYLHDRKSGQLRCVSCSLVEPRSSADSALSFPFEFTWEANLDHQIRNLSADGRRMVFESKDALVPRDTNGVIDVYQWVDGKIDLISTGRDPSNSFLFDVSEDGSDIFFTTSEQLVPSDKDALRDLYDARIGGRPEVVADAPCVADECQGTPSPPPSFGTPGSSAFRGAPNPPKPKKCRKRRAGGKRETRSKGRCVTRGKGRTQQVKQGKNGRNR